MQRNNNPVLILLLSSFLLTLAFLASYFMQEYLSKSDDHPTHSNQKALYKKLEVPDERSKKSHSQQTEDHILNADNEIPDSRLVDLQNDISQVIEYDEIAKKIEKMMALCAANWIDNDEASMSPECKEFGESTLDCAGRNLIELTKSYAGSASEDEHLESYNLFECEH